jgi:hypothetical protein
MQTTPVRPFLSDRATRRWRIVLWLAFYALTAAALTAGILGASLPGYDMGLIWPAVLTCGFIGTGWLFALLVMVFGAHGVLTPIGAVRWLAVPIAGILCAALILTNVPLRARFELSRAALDQAVARIESGGSLENSSVGLFSVRTARLNLPGETVFETSDSDSGLGACGLAHIADGFQVQDSSLGPSLGDHWFVWCEFMFDD